MLYRTNAQSRTIEDALMREGVAYKVVGGVRFYERKEVKDALAYMRLVINPHDDVSLRRVINVPARAASARASWSAVECSTPSTSGRRSARTSPECLAAGLQPALSARTRSGRASCSGLSDRRVREAAPPRR